MKTGFISSQVVPLFFLDRFCEGYHSVVLIANSIGAFFAMNALHEENIEQKSFKNAKNA